MARGRNCTANARALATCILRLHASTGQASSRAGRHRSAVWCGAAWCEIPSGRPGYWPVAAVPCCARGGAAVREWGGAGDGDDVDVDVDVDDDDHGGGDGGGRGGEDVDGEDVDGSSVPVPVPMRAAVALALVPALEDHPNRAMPDPTAPMPEPMPEPTPARLEERVDPTPVRSDQPSSGPGPELELGGGGGGDAAAAASRCCSS